MAESLFRLAAWALLPVEKYHRWNWNRRYRRGGYRRPSDIGSGAVTTRKR